MPKTDRSVRTPGSKPPLRLWPGTLLIAIQWTLWLVVPLLFRSQTVGMFALLGGVVFGLLFFVWWLFFSRASRVERWGGALLAIGGLFVARPLLDESVANAGMGLLFAIYAIPFLCLALYAWALLADRVSAGTRRIALIAAPLIVFGGWMLVRNDGVSAEGAHFAPRWSQTAEDRLLARGEDTVTGLVQRLRGGAVAEWPGFRGPLRDGVVRGVSIETDWEVAPPVEVWRRPIGPGWSSLAVHGDRIYTLEQRGEDEVVACYDVASGSPVWRHKSAARFWEPEGGAGPRGTPTLAGGRVFAFGATGLAGGRVFAFGATGLLLALDAGDGTLMWRRNVVDDAEKEAPYWGFSSSPLVVGDTVVVAAAGRLVAYSVADGALRWRGPDGGDGYSSPHALTIDGVEQVLLTSGDGVVSVAPEDGTVLWQREWGGFSIVQPAAVANGDLVLSSESFGSARLAVARGEGGWSAEEKWTSNRLKANFNDFVVHEGHAYGFDGSIMASIDLETGERNWKGGRYGQGQLVLLKDQDVLLVISEQGELALVAAKNSRTCPRSTARLGTTLSSSAIVYSFATGKRW